MLSLFKWQGYAACALMTVLTSTMAVPGYGNQLGDAEKIDSELFEAYVNFGFLNIADFHTETVLGASLVFNSSEDLFLQFSFGMADASESTLETQLLSSNTLLTGDDRDYQYINLLLGYNLFAGEVFAKKDLAYLSNLYTLVGVGTTEFGSEESFTLVGGVGYKISTQGGWVWRLEFKNQIYQSSIRGNERESVHNLELLTGIGFFF